MSRYVQIESNWLQLSNMIQHLQPARFDILPNWSISCIKIPSGKLTSLWKITIFNGKSIISMAIFNSFLYVYHQDIHFSITETFAEMEVKSLQRPLWALQEIRFAGLTAEQLLCLGRGIGWWVY